MLSQEGEIFVKQPVKRRKDEVKNFLCLFYASASGHRHKQFLVGHPQRFFNDGISLARKDVLQSIDAYDIVKRNIGKGQLRSRGPYQSEIRLHRASGKLFLIDANDLSVSKKLGQPSSP